MRPGTDPNGDAKASVLSILGTLSSPTVLTATSPSVLTGPKGNAPIWGRLLLLLLEIVFDVAETTPPRTAGDALTRQLPRVGSLSASELSRELP